MSKPYDDALLGQIEKRAVEMAHGAGAILREHFSKPLDVQFKDKNKRDLVTNVDKECQQFLCKAISENYPDHGILGEEDEVDQEQESPAQDFVWILDPLDGTKNYVGGLPIYASSIGVLYRGVPIVGAVYVPWPGGDGGAVLHARKGGGAYADDDEIAVAQSDEPQANGLVTLPGAFGGLYRFDKPMRGKMGEIRMTGSIAYELAMTARGILQYTVTTGPHLWDVAGGVMLVLEAGGLVMRDRWTSGLEALSTRTRWEVVDSLVPGWESGVTTMKELRQWTAALVLGSPGVVRLVTSNMKSRRRLRHRVARMVRTR